jgi:CheY-like chemotaxis protein
MPYGKVLIVDDVEANLYVAEGLMKPYKLQIETVASGQAAIDKIKAGKEYDIVFMDHMMPGMNGMEATKHLRELGYTAPIAVLTANAVSGQADMFLQNGFDAFISKPIDVHQLHSIILKYIRSKYPLEAIEEAKSETAAYGEALKRLLNKKISGLNILKGLERYHNDDEMYLKIMRSYTASVRSMLDSIATVSEDRIGNYEIIVHGIKGASLDIFAEELGKSAKALEDAAKAGDLMFVSENTEVFLTMLGNLVNAIEEVVFKGSGENDDEQDIPLLHEIFDTLKIALSEMDMTAIDELMARLESGNWNKELRGYIENISQNVLLFEYDDAMTAIDEIMAKFIE